MSGSQPPEYYPQPPLPVPPPFTPPSNESHRWIFVLSILAFVGLIALARVVHSVYFTRSLPPLQQESADQKHSQARVAYENNPGSPTSTTPKVDELAISTVLDQIHNAAQRHDLIAIDNEMDIDRLFGEISRVDNLGYSPAAQQAAFIQGIRIGMERMFTTNTDLVNWSSRKLKKIIFADGQQEAIVYDLETHGVFPKRYPVKARWWLRKTGSQWKIWDVELIGEGLRISAAMAAVVPAGGLASSLPAGLASSIPRFQTVTRDIKAGDLAGAESELRILNAQNLPSEFAAMREVYWGMLHIRQLQYNAALTDCDAAEKTGEDVPFAHEIRTLAYDKLGQFDNAYQSALKWENTMGGDFQVYYLMGRALAHLNRPAEAAVTFGKSLDEDPDAAGSLSELSSVLPPGKKAEIGRRFALSQNPAGVFAIAAPVLQRARDLEGMQALIDAYRAQPGSASDPHLAYYTGELMIIRGQFKQAEAVLKTLLLLPDNGEQKKFAEEFYYAAFLAKDAVNAYADSPDAPVAFHNLARFALVLGDYRTLDKLVKAYQPHFQNDPLAMYYHAKLYEDIGDFKNADDSYRSAMALGNESDLNTIRISWVYERFTSGKGFSAYADIQPSDKVFTQLARLFTVHGNKDDLSRLVDLRRADAPDDPNLPLWEAEITFLGKRYADTVELLLDHRDSIERDKINVPRWKDIYIRSEVRLGHPDAARVELSPTASGGKDWWHIAIIECAAGNARDGITALNAFLKQSNNAYVHDIYADPDLGPALASPAFASWTQSHPNPTGSASTRPGTPDDGLGA